ncbi:host cell division inhibitor Icd-like protein [Dickeya chrysanthemi]|uniref:host cell division inhibitor Icd-like protein n=1 Tax=Dickeya chrysanthemi TaxID=556 RepID=UPI00301621E1
MKQHRRQFTWRFPALGISSQSIVHIVAFNERGAQEQFPVDYVMIFADHLPIQGVCHA